MQMITKDIFKETSESTIGYLCPTGELVNDEHHVKALARAYLESHPIVERVAIRRSDRSVLLVVDRNRFSVSGGA